MTDSVMSGADAVAAALEELGVEVVFGVTGAGNLAMFDAIHTRGFSRLVFVHHEQSAVMAAEGLSRSTGKLGVAVVTTGGGSSNALTGIIGANMDSVPLLLITGNESSIHARDDNGLRVWGTQGYDSMAVFSPVSKESHRASSSADVYRLVVESGKTALAARRGTVTVDIPMDLQRKPLSAGLPMADVRPFEPDAVADLSDSLETVNDLLSRSSRPVLILGNGLRAGGDRHAIRQQAETLGIPTLLSWSGIDLLEAKHPMNFGRCGIYGDRYANMIVQNSDLVISIGSRLAIPQLSYDPSDFARHAQVVVVDIDELELEKFLGDKWTAIQADATVFLSAFSQTARRPAGLQQWVARCSSLRAEYPRRAQTVGAIPSGEEEGYVNSYEAVYQLSDAAGPDDIFVTDVGTGLLSGFYGLDLNDDQQLSSSLGLGEMGYGLPAAIGAQVGNPESRVICLNADGGMMFNLQELETIAHHALPIKLVVFSNDGYVSIKHSQQNLFEGRLVGSNAESGVSMPSFEKLSAVFGMAYWRADSKATLAETVEDFLNGDGPAMLEVVMHPAQLFIPRVGTIKGENGALMSPPLEDMIPLVSEAALSAAMDGDLHPESLKIRLSPNSMPTLGGKK